jgi:hypothetical protein
VSEAVRDSARQLAIVLAAGVAGSLALGLALGLLQEESVLRWIAYMLYIAGALAIGLAALSGTTSPGKKARKRLIDRDETDDEPADPVAAKTLISERLVLAVGGAILFAAGTLLELSV